MVSSSTQHQLNSRKSHVMQIARALELASVEKLDGAHIPMQIDIGFGDIVYPSPSELQLPSLLGYKSKSFLAYAPETSIAEKAQVILHRNIANSRMKDFYDIWLMSGSLTLDQNLLANAIASTFKARQTPLDTSSVVFTDEFFDDEAKQIQWAAFLRKRHIAVAPESFSQVARSVMSFLEPLITRAHSIQSSTAV